ncbi:NAD synthetase [Labilithrix luteola]|uniref:NH(3)-dependent NAD(+) synthetase n=1 Tax=Labilithrix luteola TaxID=1391654 RepID=A0A0K1PY95_9BACT|nr:NAD(+) synthase [Labilithrix luteola]AKU98114.1 NAD synthetase [Labilithrix luteola]
MAFTTDVLRIDSARMVRSIEEALRDQLGRTLRRKGIVVGLSGGIDSSVVAALAVRAVGPDKVLALLMPERDSSPSSLSLGKMLAKHLGIEFVVEDIAPALTAMGCYARQDDAIRTVFPEYGNTAGWTCKLTLPSILDGDRINVFQLTVRSPNGKESTSRMMPEAYRQLVAATNFKQRVRKMFEYYHADRLAYVVAGTPNRLEYDQGFFVKQGDGAADVKPIAHLYKTQVYALAEHLGVPQEIRSRPPTTDTFSMEQTQEEFYFALPYDKMDVCLYGKNHGVSASDVARAIGLTPLQVERVYRDIDAKRRTTRWLHSPPLLVEPVTEMHGSDAEDVGHPRVAGTGAGV